ncbi:MAG: AsmA-like C-terminal region-containing protein, partial [Desulfobacterales bacterium]|nr:AsmA-like C-terminal region-containing protein [Desulfobacterales bacterium]
NIPRVALQASADKVDVGRLLRQIGLSEEFSGTVATARFEGQSSGRTLTALLDQAVLDLKLQGSDLQFKGQFAGRPIDLVVGAAAITNDREGPLQAVFNGTFQGLPYDATARTAPLKELLLRQTPLPVQLKMKTAYADFTGRGTVARPLSKRSFDLEHEISGDKIEGLDPLIDLALPLKGAFRATGTITGRGGRLNYVEDLRVGKSDFQMTLDLWQQSSRHVAEATITSDTVYLDNINLISESDPLTHAPQRRYLIPEYTLPVDYLRIMDLDIDIRAQRVLADIGDLGKLESQVTLKNGHFVSTSTIAKPDGSMVRKHMEVDATVDPPMNKLEIDAHGIDYTFLRQFNPATILEEGALDLHLRLAGAGTTRRKILSQSNGALTIIGGPGRLRERRIDLWAADLIPTLLSPQWRREETIALNCMVGHITVADGLATIDNALLDTRLVTIAASGAMNLKNEELDIYIVPRPKRASLVSLANPVRVSGTMTEPQVAVAKLPGRSTRRLARTGILAGLINPLFLITALSDTGTMGANSCADAITRAQEGMAEAPPDR